MCIFLSTGVGHRVESVVIGLLNLTVVGIAL